MVVVNMKFEFLDANKRFVTFTEEPRTPYTTDDTSGRFDDVRNIDTFHDKCCDKVLEIVNDFYGPIEDDELLELLRTLLRREMYVTISHGTGPGREVILIRIRDLEQPSNDPIRMGQERMLGHLPFTQYNVKCHLYRDLVAMVEFDGTLIGQAESLSVEKVAESKS